MRLKILTHAIENVLGIVLKTFQIKQLLIKDLQSHGNAIQNNVFFT